MNKNNIRPSKMKRIQIQILFGMWKNIRIYSNNEKYFNYSNNSYILNNLDKIWFEQKFPLLGTPVQCKCKMYILFNHAFQVTTDVFLQCNVITQIAAKPSI